MTVEQALTLAIDCATDTVGVAIVRGQIVLAETVQRAGHHHSAVVLSAVDDLCRRHACPPATWVAGQDGLAVAVGPGSFNGVRTGIATTLGLALGTGVRVAAHSSLECLAYQMWQMTGVRPNSLLCPVLPAGRGEVYVATYRVDDASSWYVEQGARACAIACVSGWVESSSASTIIIGGAGVPMDWSPPTARSEVILLSPLASLRRPSFLAALAHAQGRFYGAEHAIDPLYIRHASVTRSQRSTLAAQPLASPPVAG